MMITPRTGEKRTASPAVPLDDAVVAIGRTGDADVREYLAELSHLDPDDNPLEHARIWQEIHAADYQESIEAQR